MQSPIKTIAIVAGEASGDLLGSHLMETLKQAMPDLRFIGIGGPENAGCRHGSAFSHGKNLPSTATSKYCAIIAKSPASAAGCARNSSVIRRIYYWNRCAGFQFGSRTRLKQRGIPTVHYVSPSIWAWRGERIHKIKRAVSRILALFPFEAPLYEKVGVPVSYVGHPLGRHVARHAQRAAMREQMRLPKQARVFAFLPGSRQSEVRNWRQLSSKRPN
ncbi:MAG: hypothetical protein WDM70_01375 [Nitrosomonadales bacterium]